MPELPEIETVKLQLEKVLVGRKLVKVIVNSNKTVKGDIAAVKNKNVKSIKRMGKVLLINFGDGLDLGFHFKMTGQLVYESNNQSMPNAKSRIVGGHPTEDYWNKMPSKHTRVIFEFDRGTLYFNDQRLFGWVMLNPEFVDKLGPEPFDLSAPKFLKLLKGLKKPIKSAIMDQEIISGVGNIYANDALWEARINPRIPANMLTAKQYSDLFIGVVRVLREGIKYGGATASDAKYIDLHGLGGHYQEHFRVYDRENLPCLRCKTKIEKIVLGGRGTYYCPICQQYGRDS